MQRDPLAALDHLLVALTALSGFALDDMTQDDGWRLLMLGRRLERVQFLATLLSDRLRPERRCGRANSNGCSTSAVSGITYRTRYVAAPEADAGAASCWCSTRPARARCVFSGVRFAPRWPTWHVPSAPLPRNRSSWRSRS